MNVNVVALVAASDTVCTPQPGTSRRALPVSGAVYASRKFSVTVLGTDVTWAGVIDDSTGRLDGATATSLLPVIRAANALSVRLPGPGDPQGLPPGPATTAAFEAGEVLLIDDPAGERVEIERTLRQRQDHVRRPHQEQGRRADHAALEHRADCRRIEAEALRDAIPPIGDREGAGAAGGGELGGNPFDTRK